MRRKRKLYYVTGGLGCGIRSGLSVEEVEREETIRQGTYNGPVFVKEATEEELSWVKSMGGYVPEL